MNIILQCMQYIHMQDKRNYLDAINKYLEIHATVSDTEVYLHQEGPYIHLCQAMMCDS